MKKKCNGCGEEKELNEFRKDRNMCKVCFNKQVKKWRDANKDRINAQKRLQYQKNREKNIEISKRYGEGHREEKRKYNKQYNIDHKEEIRENKRKYKKERMATDINFRIAENLKARMKMAVKGNFKSGSAVRDLGCSIPEFKERFEKMFYPHPVTGEMMTWDNYGKHGWHMDHIVPLSWFNLSDRDQFLCAAHYMNLQPLWAEENIAKGDKII